MVDTPAVYVKCDKARPHHFDDFFGKVGGAGRRAFDVKPRLRETVEVSHLQAAGLVEIRHGVGTLVLDLPAVHQLGPSPMTVVTVRDVLAILEMRISLKTEGVSLAASRRGNAQLQQLRAALDAFCAAVRDGSEAVPADAAFHILVARCSGNRYFPTLLGYLSTNLIRRSRIDSARLANIDPASFMQRAIDEHEDI